METQEQIKLAVEFIEQSMKQQLIDAVTKGEKQLFVDFSSLVLYSPELANELLENTEEVMKVFEIAVEQFNNLGNNPEQFERFTIRVFNLPKDCKTLLTDVRVEHVSRLISVEGIIKGLTQVTGRITAARFECPSCGNVIRIIQSGDKFREPTRCGCGRRGKFNLLTKDTVNAFTIMLEEAPDMLNNSNPNLATLQVIFTRELCLPRIYSRLASGVRILVNGVLVEFFKEKGNAKLTEVSWYLDANYIHIFDDDYSEMVITAEDEQKIIEFGNKANCFEEMAEQIYSDVEGLPNEKQTLTLQIAGGCKFEKQRGVERGDIHILMVGDSSTAKTRMAKTSSIVCPKSRYVSGGSSSKVGLGAGVERDEILGRHYLVAGALPLAHKGLCVLDEFDGFSDEDTKMLNEATEMQEIHVNKIVKGTFRTETSVLYCANPKNGKFDEYEVISKQINIKPALISRCDSILTFRDVPEVKKDGLIAKTMLNGKQQLKEVLPLEFIRKYFMYIKRFNPVVTEDVNNYIADKFVEIRQKMSNTELKNIPISFRDIFSIRRFATALARIKQLNKVTLVEAEKAFSLKCYSLYQVAFDHETGVIDMNRVNSGVTISDIKIIQLVKEFLNQNIYVNGIGAPIDEVTDEIIKKNPSLNLTGMRVNEIITGMGRSGDIFFPRRGYIRVL